MHFLILLVVQAVMPGAIAEDDPFFRYAYEKFNDLETKIVQLEKASETKISGLKSEMTQMKEGTVKFHELTADDGTAHATSTFTRYGDYKAVNAFKIQGATDDTYWSSKRNVRTPVYLWFQFKEPKCVTKIKFEEQYKLAPGEVYEVFGSNTLEHCENPSNQTILTTGTADVFSGGKEFENKLKFYCYGLKMHNPTKQYTGVKRLQFAFKDAVKVEELEAELQTEKSRTTELEAAIQTEKSRTTAAIQTIWNYLTNRI